MAYEGQAMQMIFQCSGRKLPFDGGNLGACLQLDRTDHCLVSGTAIINGDDYPFSLGLCIPSSCSPSDVSSKAVTLLRRVVLLQDSPLLPLTVSNVDCDSEVEREMDANASLCLTFIAIILSLTVVGTAYDSWRRRNAPVVLELSPLFGSDKKDTQRVPPYALWSSFSLVRNGEDLIRFDPPPPKEDLPLNGGRSFDLRILNGMRVLSMCWLILGRTAVQISKLSSDNVVGKNGDAGKPYFQIVVGSYFCS
jgi:hypothetical protein